MNSEVAMLERMELLEAGATERERANGGGFVVIFIYSCCALSSDEVGRALGAAESGALAALSHSAGDVSLALLRVLRRGRRGARSRRGFNRGHHAR